VATYTYGHSSNDFVEIPDPTTANQTVRPTIGLAVAVRDAYTLADLPGTTSGPFGYLDFTATSSAVRVSTDGFATWRELYGEEAVRGALTAAVDATTARADAGAALAKVNALDVRVGSLEAGGTTGTGGPRSRGPLRGRRSRINRRSTRRSSVPWPCPLGVRRMVWHPWRVAWCRSGTSPSAPVRRR
jgi:hypothetical protein